MKLVTTASVVLSEPVIEKGKQVRVKTQYKGREIEIDAHEHTQVKPGAIIDVDIDTAKELTAAGAARKAIAGIDFDFDEGV